MFRLLLRLANTDELLNKEIGNKFSINKTKVLNQYLSLLVFKINDNNTYKLLYCTTKLTNKNNNNTKSINMNSIYYINSLWGFCTK